MWKVQRKDDGNVIVLVVSGRLERENLAELREVFNAEAASENFVLDMTGVRLVDQDTIAFLSSCEASGARLRNCPPYIREWMEKGRECGN